MDKQDFIEEQIRVHGFHLAQLRGFYSGLRAAGISDDVLRTLKCGIDGAQKSVSDLTDFLEQEYNLYKIKEEL